MYRAEVRIDIARAPAVVDLHIPADAPAQLLHGSRESREARLFFRIIGGEILLLDRCKTL